MVFFLSEEVNMEGIGSGEDNVPQFLKDFNRITSSWYPIIISLGVALVTILRMYMGGPRCPSVNRVDKKVMVITGGCSGIGLETAKELASRGATLILTARTKEKGEKAVEEIQKVCPMANVFIKEVDLSSMSSIRQFAKDVNRQFEVIDVLINNVGTVYKAQKRTSEGYEVTFATNYFGPFLLSHLLLPALCNSHNGRIINLTALAHFSTKLTVEEIEKNPTLREKEVFAKTKLAVMLFTKHMGRICRNLKVTINAVNPGIVRNTQHFESTSVSSNLFTKISVWPWTWLFLKTPNQGCQTVVYCAIEPVLDVTTGAYFSDCSQQDSAPETKDYKLAAAIYKKTCEILEINSQKMIHDLTQPI